MSPIQARACNGRAGNVSKPSRWKNKNTSVSPSSPSTESPWLAMCVMRCALSCNRVQCAGRGGAGETKAIPLRELMAQEEQKEKIQSKKVNTVVLEKENRYVRLFQSVSKSVSKCMYVVMARFAWSKNPTLLCVSA